MYFNFTQITLVLKIAPDSHYAPIASPDRATQPYCLSPN
jgi:hypothetical protein